MFLFYHIFFNMLNSQIKLHLCEHLPKGLLLFPLCHLLGWLGPEGCWAGTSLPSPGAGTAAWMQRWGGGGESIWGGSLAWTGLARHFFLPYLSKWSLQQFGPLVHEAEWCFLCCCKACFCELQKPHGPDSLGKFGERKWVMRCFVRYYSNTRRSLLLGFEITFLSL